jgi:hypothetical protein
MRTYLLSDPTDGIKKIKKVLKGYRRYIRAVLRGFKIKIVAQ